MTDHLPAAVTPTTAGEVEQTPPAAGVARTKWCVGCNQVLPRDSFGKNFTTNTLRSGERKKSFTRARICKECAKVRKAKRDIAKRKENSDRLQGMLGRMAGSKNIDVAHISEVAAALTTYMGGVEPAAKAWAANIEVANEIAPGKRDTIKNYEGWANLILKSTENRQTAPDVVGMTTEDIEREMRRLFLEQDSLERMSGEN